MRPRISTSSLSALSIAAALHGIAASAGLATPGALVQLEGTDGCISENGSNGDCADGRGLGGALDLTVSRDGKSVYVASFSSDALAMLTRNTSSLAGPIGKLTQTNGPESCISETGNNGLCTDGTGLVDPFAVAISRDGKSIYVAGAESDAIAAFSRDRKTTVVAQLPGTDACISEDGSAGACVDGKGLGRPVGVAITPNGKHVYATANTTASLTVMLRNKSKLAPLGALSPVEGPAGCLSNDGSGGECTDSDRLNGGIGIAPSPDGRHVYVASSGASAVLAFSRNPKTGELTPLAGTAACVSNDGSGGACVDGKALGGARPIAISRDGKNVYVGAEGLNAIAVFSRDRKTGALTQLPGTDGCIADSTLGGLCADGKALRNPRGLAVSRDGRNVYVGSSVDNAVAVLSRDTRTGALAQLPGTEGCVSETGSNGECADGKGLSNVGAVAVSEDGRTVYVASFSPGGVAVFARQKK